MSIIDAFRLDGKVAVVTGANTGLGQGMSVALAQAGAKVVGVARRSCEDTKKLIEADGGEFTEVIADLSDMAAIETIVNGALAAYGQVDILVNNAGLIKRNDAIDFTEDEWDSVIQVNQKMVFFLSQAFAKQYIKQQDGGNFRREFLEKEENIEPEEIKIIRTKEIEMKPMYPEDACVQMELLGHNFFVFFNAETEQVNVVYKRKGNTYGLIEPEF